MGIQKQAWIVTPALVGAALTGYQSATVAQLIPDQTLGVEQSLIESTIVRDDLAELIRGGALRDSNLFHSFREFNVQNGQRVYFFNPEGVENILGRVTGDNVSNIFGTLGVDGNANLFLLNPNGVVFGPNAQLDLEGSFWASTADRVEFSDGSTFAARNPQAVPLVTVNIPIGLQFAADAPAAVRNSAALIVGKDLRLSGGDVASDGSLTAGGLAQVEAVTGDVAVRALEAGSAELVAQGNVLLEQSELQTQGDLTLLARDTVRVRDSEALPVQVAAGGDLLIQGDQNIDILALNHPQTPFVSGGELTLVSDGIISGDAHYASGGDFSMETVAGEPGNFISLYDPIITSAGNVTLGNYDGVSLKVEAGGGIRTGDITIEFAENPTIINSNDPDFTTLTGGAALILRSGVSGLEESGPGDPNNPDPQNPRFELGSPDQNLPISGNNIDLDGIIGVGYPPFSRPGQILIQSGSGGSINVNGALDSSGGIIELEAENEINFNSSIVDSRLDSALEPEISLNAGNSINFNGTARIADFITTQGDESLVNINDSALIQDFRGGDGNDILNFNDNSRTINVGGGSGDDIFNFNNNSNVIENILGGPGNDLFTLNGGRLGLFFGGSIPSFTPARIDGGEGSNTLQGTLVQDDFSILNEDSGQINFFRDIDDTTGRIIPFNLFTSFQNIQSIDGRSGDDIFQFSQSTGQEGEQFSGRITGELNGGEDLDIVKFEGYDGISVVLTEQVSGIASAIGGFTPGQEITNYEGLEILVGDGILEDAQDEVLENFVVDDVPLEILATGSQPLPTDPDVLNTIRGTQREDVLVVTNNPIRESDSSFDIRTSTQLINFTQIEGDAGDDTVILRSTENIVDEDVFVNRPVTEILSGEGDDTILFQGGTITNRIDGGSGRLILQADGAGNLTGLPPGQNSITGVVGNSTLALETNDPEDDIAVGNSVSGGISLYNDTVANAIDESSFDGLVIGRSDGTGALTTTGPLNVALPLTLQHGSITAGGNITAPGQDVTAIANEGDVNLNAGNLSTTNFAGNAGNIRIEASNGQVQVSQLEANSTGAGNGGAIDIDAAEITVSNGGINSIATGSGNSGPIDLNATSNININNSSVSTQVNGSGRARDITIETPTLNLTGGPINGSPSFSDPAIPPIPEGPNEQTNDAPLAQLSSAASVSPQLGNSQPDSLDGLANRDPNRSEIASRSDITTPEAGAAGNISITAADITLNNGAIITETERNPDRGSGNITLQATGSTLEMRNESLILAQGNGTIGGNIRILDFTTVFGDDPTTGPNGNDIIVNSVGVDEVAFIELTNDTGFIRQPPKLGNQTNDISSPAFEDPTVQPRTLPENATQFLNVDQIIRQGCSAKTPGLSSSKFEVQGRGGLPENPLTLLSGGISQSAWNTLGQALPGLPTSEEVAAESNDKADASATAPPKNSIASSDQCVVQWLTNS